MQRMFGSIFFLLRVPSYLVELKDHVVSLDYDYDGDDDTSVEEETDAHDESDDETNAEGKRMENDKM